MNTRDAALSLVPTSASVMDDLKREDEAVEEFNPHLLFESRGVLWAVEASVVREVLLLPEIAPLDGAPWWIGVLDVRGKMLPVVEPGELSGAAPRRFQTTDSVIIVDSPQGQLGLIVEAVRDVRPLVQNDHEGTPTGIVRGLTRVDSEIVRLLNLSFLARFVAREEMGPEASPARPFCPDASSEERALFLHRSHALHADIIEDRDESTAPTLVAVRLGGEIFGLELGWVREFAQRFAVTPVPGAPGDLLGLVNLRGEVVPLLDLRPALGLAVAGDVGEHITFVECDGTHVGVAVEAVLDVFAPREGELLPVPAASGLSGDVVRAAVIYEDSTLAVLDLRNLLQQGGWITRDSARL